MGIPVCKRSGIAEKFAYGDPIMHNEIVRIGMGINIYIVRFRSYLVTDIGRILDAMVCTSLAWPHPKQASYNS